MEIKPLTAFDKTIETAPDKSITHRAVMFNALADGTATVKNALLGNDCLSTIDCMRALGAEIERDGSTVRIKGTNALRSASLYVGNSGTTFRLLAGALAGRKGEFTLDGDASIRRRPMKRVIDPLAAMGADITAEEGGLAPVRIKGGTLAGISYDMPVASAQVKSAILLAGLNADGTTSVHEKIPSRNHTEIMLKNMGARITTENLTASVTRSTLAPLDVEVPGDISSAAYPFVLACCMPGGRVTVRRVGVNRTRTGILDVMRSAGAEIEESDLGGVGELRADVTVKYSPSLRPFTVKREQIPFLIDEIPALAVLACFIEGESVISGAEELKVKESNRIDTTVAALRAMGADIEPTSDGMIVRGKGYLAGGAVVDPKGDHRIAMSMSVAAALSKKGATILDPECAFVSYPGFYALFD